VPGETHIDEAHGLQCIRVAEPDTRAALIDEMVNRLRLEKLLRDSYANYVVQTSLDYAEPRQRAQVNKFPMV